MNWRGNASPDEPITDNSPHQNAGLNVGAEVVVSSAPLVFNIRRNSKTEIETQFVLNGGTRFRLESSADLLNWVPVLTNVAPAGGYVRFPQTVGAERGPKLFRVVAQ